MAVNRVARVQTLPLIALRGLTVFPQTVLHFDVGRKKSIIALSEAIGGPQKDTLEPVQLGQYIFLVAQTDLSVDDPTEEQLYPIGVVAKIKQVLRLSGEGLRVLVEGVYRARIQDLIQTDPYYIAVTKECLDQPIGDPIEEEALIRECRKSFREYSRFLPQMSPDIVAAIANATEAGFLADFIAAHIDLSLEDKQDLLSTLSVAKRMEKLLLILQRETRILKIEQAIHQQVQEKIEQHQREYYLREQMKVISEELGDDDNPVEESEIYRDKIRKLGLPEEIAEKLYKECDRLARMPSGSHEATVVRGYLDTCLELPWNNRTRDSIDLTAARRQLDKDHYGLEKVKDHIIEMLAVRALGGESKGQVLCLVGPPGVGKTSIAKSIAAAMGRKYVRISLGGVRDEADIRGHRRTYIGAMPGRIINAIRQAGVKNPVLLLDEIDKMSSDFRGDPAAAMLEVLDTEQNSGFVDHYLGLPFDLSEVLFITTANNPSNIPGPLYDRMDILTLSSYTIEEKFHIAKEHLIKKQRKRHGLTARQLRFTDSAIRQIIVGYTREAGVRKLEQRIAEICRKVAKMIVAGEAKSVTVSDLERFLGPVKYKPDDRLRQDAVGVVNGLAWTPVGGETMPVEVAILDGTGKIELTGSLGEVMKESARTAISYVRSRAEEWNIDKDFYKTKDIHIHIPEGAVPKDGPSAGVTIATAILSALTGIPVRHEVAMTGEISLRGRVMPIGGLKEKSMAAYINQMKTVIIPKSNEPDLQEIDQVVRENLEWVTADHLDTVIRTALVRMPESSKQPHTYMGGMAAATPCSAEQTSP